MTSVCAAALGLCLCNPISAWAEAVPDGIYVAGQNLGGMDTEDAKQLIDTYVSGLSGQTITLDVAGTKVETTAEKLGFHWENTDVVEDTVSEYNTGNVISRYFRQKDLEKAPIEVELQIKIDGNAVADFVRSQCQPLIQEAVDATIVRENGAFVVTPSRNGLGVDVDTTVQRLGDALSSGLEEPIYVEAVTEELIPYKTTEMLESIQDVLGTFTTSFASSGASRATNVQVGSGKINGTVLMPGETLSGYEAMGPLTIANGYANAASYANGLVVDSIGGGVCQISTTLYNAALLAEMEIAQRQNHSMIVTYVEPSMDAAIAGTYKDLKITNPYDTPLYIEADSKGKKLTFTIYGKETRPANRTIKYVSETIQTIDPGAPIEQQDLTLEPGARVRVQSAHIGYKSRLWKYVYMDGVEQERIILNTDTYGASKAIYRVGPPVPETMPETAPQTAPVVVGPGADNYGPGMQPTQPTHPAGPIGPGM